MKNLDAITQKYKIMKEIKNTIDGVELIYQRRVGNSIRQIDAAINHLFNGFKVEVKDHWENGTNKKANRCLFDGILGRLQSEHRLDVLIKEKKIKIDKNKFTLELI